MRGFNINNISSRPTNNSYSFKDFNRNRQPIKVIGYKEKKLGGWDEETQEKIEQITGKSKEETKEPEKIEEEESNSDIELNSKEGEDRWNEFQKMISEKKVEEQPKKKEISAADPFFIMMNKKTEKPLIDYIPGQPNRFGIHPGPWWDGIDRSNGYERRRFEKKQEVDEEKSKEIADRIARW
ncbi:hypothetical protein TVAG_080230 [Trichomonas vaginalis G3]|uniref:Pre-mRNA-splicing factor CWC26 n=1 Tax=Trichomonas vaginalis (strain ATCC PRA-98 / G3) TaxID=412133 RepID=A2FBH6_TRIV3|nr:pre-mRNA-splicing factor of RES complex family [Trichomonas vaginalis G3]EAX97763.1 hypothetical protein TVAG_080230 [Trichomonas vaginalis G3]KAI5491162.1 pre-mRNA-splicing factor of RES complex family [Trichomonas vaginalis G3]|eukprot:XP_001310693.1 hypothetical protein [Trichomonas vaginalis G3]